MAQEGPGSILNWQQNLAIVSRHSFVNMKDTRLRESWLLALCFQGAIVSLILGSYVLELYFLIFC